MNKQHDWKALETEFIQGDMGQRELARMHDITNYSLVTAQARKHEWVRKRTEYRAQTEDRTIYRMADDEAKRRVRELRVRDNAIEAIDEAISKMRADMKATRKVFKDDKWVDEPLVVIRPQDMAMLIDRLQVLFGKPTAITEERQLGISLATHDPDLFRGIIEATRGVAATGGDAASSPLPRIGGAREN